MQIPLGRVLQVDMGSQKWGMILYLVIKPTLICNNCGQKINNWRKDKNGYICCPYCYKLTEQIYQKCPYCNEYDLMRLRVIQSDNWGIDNQQYIEARNSKVGRGISLCKKQLQKQIKTGKIRLLSAKESVDKKRLIQWSRRDDYDPSKPIPEQIIQYWKYQEQQ